MVASSTPRVTSARRVVGRRGVNTTLAPRRRAGVAMRAGDDYDNATIDLDISTEEARGTLQFDKVVMSEEEGPVIFVTGRASYLYLI